MYLLLADIVDITFEYAFDREDQLCLLHSFQRLKKVEGSVKKNWHLAERIKTDIERSAFVAGLEIRVLDGAPTLYALFLDEDANWHARVWMSPKQMLDIPLEDGIVEDIVSDFVLQHDLQRFTMGYSPLGMYDRRSVVSSTTFYSIIQIATDQFELTDRVMGTRL